MLVLYHFGPHSQPEQFFLLTCIDLTTSLLVKFYVGSDSLYI